MAGALARIPMNRRIFTWGDGEIESSIDPAMNLSDTVFGFLEEEHQGSFESHSSKSNGENEDRDENEEIENLGSVEDNKVFWETQHQLLQGTLCRTSSLESRIRNITKQAIKELELVENVCACRRPPVAHGCRHCLMREVCSSLQNAGLNSAICKSKWRSSPKTPSGEHTFLDVVDNSISKKGEIKVIIELNFRAEFEMARGNEEYNRLISRLPEIFVGKVERLVSLIKILCSSAKKCLKENKMHMAPWRKQRYMEAKWLRTCERTTSTLALSATGYSSRPVRPRASMLTVDLLENLSNLHRTAVEVV
ncbi:unnamed protein product [Ilex paraguariensis]|uniref:Uncharacterized protein n=1 Tax=Ilex paraguariensis TaxID=185542 RepID=A0ABC8UL66_9AQUA